MCSKNKSKRVSLARQGSFEQRKVQKLQTDMFIDSCLSNEKSFSRLFENNSQAGKMLESKLWIIWGFN